MKKTYSKCFPLKEFFREKALQWASGLPYCSYLTSSNIQYPEGPFKELLAASTKNSIDFGNSPFDALFQFHQQNEPWLFGYFTYELKNSIHGLTSSRNPTIPFPACSFFQPEFLFFFHKTEVEIRCIEISPDQIYQEIMGTSVPRPEKLKGPITLHQHISRKEYLKKVEAIRQHILEGDCYELNLCQEFSATGVKADPLSLFLQLNYLSPAPFASFLRLQNFYLIGASPERFMKKEGYRLVSQPIKGTTRRGKSEKEDELLKHQLRHDEKEQAENMMIVDLVRNDLARSSRSGSVKVDEMFGIYSFKYVHQMISTVSGTLRPEVPFTDALKNAFPMGSMTGAPKKKVMELIERYEKSARGLYSGSVGYITPEGDFDFNVVIRSLLFDKNTSTLSFQVGGAITYDSVPEKEYEECLLKASALLQVLATSIPLPS